MRYIYAGAPAFSVPPLQQMLAAGFCVCAVLTRPDRPVGRRARLTPTPLKAFAQEAGIPVLDYERVRDHAADLAALGADALVTCAYGQILTQEVLDAFPRGVYNIHASLLPRWRGASPIQHAVWAGDAETGITVMRTDVGLDTGDVLLRRALPLDGTETAGGLAALDSEGLDEMRDLTNYYLANAAIIADTLRGRKFADAGVEVYFTGNAPYVWVRFPGRKSWEIFDKILDECRVVTTPGAGFGPSGESFIRFSSFGHRENVMTACGRLSDKLSL